MPGRGAVAATEVLLQAEMKGGHSYREDLAWLTPGPGSHHCTSQVDWGAGHRLLLPASPRAQNMLENLLKKGSGCPSVVEATVKAEARVLMGGAVRRSLGPAMKAHIQEVVLLEGAMGDTEGHH